MAPSDLNVLARQLPRPENSLSPAPLPTSAANLKIENKWVLVRNLFVNNQQVNVIFLDVHYCYPSIYSGHRCIEEYYPIVINNR